MMIETILLAAFFAIALAAEWRWRKASIRLGTAVLALFVLWFTQPVPHRAARRAVDAPPAERVAELRGERLSEYESGILTMRQAIIEDGRMFRNDRLLALGVLMWLACSPALRRDRPSPGEAVSVPDEDRAPGQ
jgi:hypothetical protein